MDIQSWLRFTSIYEIDPFLAARPHADAFARWIEQQCPEGDTRPYAPRTVGRRLSTVSSLMEYLVDLGLRESNPMARVRRPALPKEGATRALDLVGIRKLLTAAAAAGDEKYLLALLLAVNALRVSEAASITVESLVIDGGHRTAKVTKKGSPEGGRVPLPTVTWDVAQRLAAKVGTGPLIRRQDGQGADDRTCRRWIEAIGKSAGLGHTHPHMLRASACSLGLAAGVSLDKVQDLLRHQSPTTTRLYDRRDKLVGHAAHTLADLFTTGATAGAA